MLRLFWILFAAIVPTLFVSAQSTWTTVDGPPPLRTNLEREIIPAAYTTYKLDEESLLQQLKDAPHKSDALRSFNGVTVNMPQPDGSIANYTVWEAPVMAPGISARYPSIKTYQGYNTVVPSEVIRFDISVFGLRAAIRSAEGEIYIDPYALGQTEYYISYFTRDDHGTGLADGALQCGVTASESEIENLIKQSKLERRTADGEIVDLRSYRLAIAGTAEWSNVRGTVERCLADVNTAVNRLNLIWENEASITMELIDRNDELFFFDPATEPYSDTRQGRVLIGENTSVLNGIVGFDAYDIGHVFSRCFDVGGIAARPSVCQIRKGAAVTCANGNNPTRWAIGTLAHEVGHQFSMNHSFNHCDGDNEAPANGFEPGSGSTIMSYAGLCGSQLNVQDDNDDYFHVGSLIEAYAYTRSGMEADECSARTVTGNRAPIVEIPYEDGFFIPISTPFEVTGEATDADGDMMTYNWEQMDTGPLSPRGAPIGNAPLFRSLYPSESKTRVFPNLNDLLNLIPNMNEVLPTTSRDITLAFVARDNHPGSGTASWQFLEFKTTADAGPFTVEYPNNFVELIIGEEVEVTWDVANTDAPPVLAEHVDIYFSTDGGYTYPHLLAESVPNDGSQVVVLPNDPTLAGRIKIKASENIFFDVSNRNFELVAPSTSTFTVESGVLNIDVCLPDVVEVPLPTVPFNGYAEEISFSILEGLPQGATVTFDPPVIAPGETSTMRVDLEETQGSDRYELVIAATGSDGQVVERSVAISTTGTDFSTLTTMGAADGTTGAPLAPTLEWSQVPDATYYRVELATSPSFAEETIILSRLIAGQSASPNVVLTPGTVYYWRVFAGNSCAEGVSPISAFSTASLACQTYTSPTLPRAIGTTVGGINVRIDVTAAGELADVNVKRIAGDHTRVGDLSATLTSPQGTEIDLWTPRCATQQDYDLTLDDEAPNPLSCPLRGGQLYQPSGSLSDFIGEEIAGVWTLRVQDNRSGNGGSVDVAELEICGNITLSPPELAVIDTAVVQRGDRTVIANTSLLAEDANHTADQLLYTLVSAPVSGDVLVDGQAIGVGGQWTQEDINRGRLVYRHGGDDADTDDLSFTVEDPDGGWVQITTLGLQIVGLVDTEDLFAENTVTVFPNPVSDLLTIEIGADSWDMSAAKVQLYNYSGQVVLSTSLTHETQQLDVRGLEAGLYLLEVVDNSHRVVRKVSVLP